MADDNIDLDRRITRMETSHEECRKSDAEALRLAREITQSDIALARQQIDSRLNNHNEWKKRWDKREAILATKDDVNTAVRILLGIILAVVTILGILIRVR